MKRLLPYLIFVLVTGGLIAFIYKDQLFPSSEPADAAKTAAAGAQGGGRGGHRRGDQIVPVIATKVKSANVPVYLNGVGTVQAFNTAVVRTQVSGRLIEVPYTEGQAVKEGDVLAKVDPSLIRPPTIRLSRKRPRTKRCSPTRAWTRSAMRTLSKRAPPRSSRPIRRHRPFINTRRR